MDTQSLQIEVELAETISGAHKESLRTLSAAVYPPASVADWPGRSIEWAAGQWSVTLYDACGNAASSLNALVTRGLVNGTGATIGGVGGVRTHPIARGKGFASQLMKRALETFRERDVDFALLVCEEKLVPLYESLGWQRHRGDLVVMQKGQKERFTFNLPMTYALRLNVPQGAIIDLLGPPW